MKFWTDTRTTFYKTRHLYVRLFFRFNDMNCYSEQLLATQRDESSRMSTVAQLDADLMTLEQDAYERSTEPAFHRNKVDNMLSGAIGGFVHVYWIVVTPAFLHIYRSHGDGCLGVRQENYARARSNWRVTSSPTSRSSVASTKSKPISCSISRRRIPVSSFPKRLVQLAIAQTSRH